MADQPVTREKLINADKDVQVIEDFIKKSKDETVTTRFGDQIMTLKGLEEEVKKSGGYFKRYTSLAAANADLANIPVDAVVKVTSAVGGGDYEKVSAEATTLAKSAYDPLTQAKKYTDAAVNELGISSNETSGISIAIVDKNDKRTWLEADGEGKPTDYSAGLVKEAIGNDFEATPTHVKSTYQAAEIKIVSGPDIICWGDSMTQGAGITGLEHAYPAKLQTLLGNFGSTATVRNSGCGGETSFTIAARQGGNPMRLYAESGVIPASPTAVKMVMLDNNSKPIRPLVQRSGIPETNNDLYFDGTINGIHGRLAIVKPNGTSPIWDDANYYTFTRSEAGTEVILNRPTPFYLDFAEARREDIAVFWTGQNNETPSESVIADTKAMINHLKPMSKRYLIISRPRPYLNLAAQIADEEKLYLEYGSRFINVRQYLIDYGLADAGITPTSQDLSDIASGLVPSSLRSDGTHFNNAGYAVVAKIVFERLKQLGWV